MHSHQVPCNHISVIGAGPAGLMAATVLAQAGLPVHLYDAMKGPGRKFLLAGKGGLNLTRRESPAIFASRYGEQTHFFRHLLSRFSPDHLQRFLSTLGVETFTGSSGRVFPHDQTAGQILERWLEHLHKAGVAMHFSHRLLDWETDGSLRFSHAGTPVVVRVGAAVLALGGASWPRTGSDGSWTTTLSAHGISCTPFAPANCGVEVAWSPFFRDRFAGLFLKNLRITAESGAETSGEAVICGYGLEGGAIYPLARELRASLAAGRTPLLFFDLKRDLSLAQVLERLERSRGKRSLAKHLQSTLRLGKGILPLIRECLPQLDCSNTPSLAGTIKALPVQIRALRPLAEAISSAGGVAFAELDEWLMLRKCPGIFVAGEMLDWEAPTGGYLLQGAFSTGWLAGQGALRWMQKAAPRPASKST